MGKKCETEIIVKTEYIPVRNEDKLIRLAYQTLLNKNNINNQFNSTVKNKGEDEL
ncbi:hypothetical protein GCM10010995_26830 [Cysteiniphilum litorale]|uniref:Uncharacterized protein n=1 Tax=Cysteiniphilum litorale TaxID=2056700 RepID=A0A8J2Z700_9GAMM|nr:hypothetical protein GCM10010995_26830 [Cysteiniphilum litorale]